MQDLTNGWYQERFLAAYAELGSIAEASRIVGVNEVTIYRRQADTPAFADGLATARQRFAEKLVSKATTAVLNATSEQTMLHPTLPIAVVNWYNPDLRPNAKVEVNVGVQVNHADIDQAAEAYFRTRSERGNL